ncbi:nucleoside hydrolase [Clostridia bacterium]|nr:nucleoside hydrolase [Clostridia bacterium]
MNEKLSVFLDTDIGSDVDDVGAIALMHELSKYTGIPIIGMTHCTSSPYGVGCMDVLNRLYDMPNIPIGILKKPGFMDGSNGIRNHIYSQYLTEHWPNRVADGQDIPDARDVLRDVLAAQPDHSVILVTIGFFTNLAMFVSQPEDLALVERKVHHLVSMAGCFVDDPSNKEIPRVEWNVLMDVPSAQAVMNVWPTPIDFAPFETGLPIITGVNWHGITEDNPLRKAYAIHSPNGRNSWDLTAVWSAMMPIHPWFTWKTGTVTMAPDGQTMLSEEPDGMHRVLALAEYPAKIAEMLDEWMAGARGEDTV